MTENEDLDEKFDRWHELNTLLPRVQANAEAIHDFAFRIWTRFGVQLRFFNDGKPHAVRTAEIMGSHPPYWSYFQYTDDRRVAGSVLDEGRGLISQAISLRKQIVALFPDMDQRYVFPLMLRSMT